MSIDVKQLLNGIGQMQYFDVVVELSEPLEFKGVIPFDLTIADGIATFKVLASDLGEARQKVQEFLDE